MERLEKLSSQKVCVGVPASTAERGDSEADSEAGNAAIGNADLVYIHTHGVRPPAERAEMQVNINKGVKYSAAMQMYIREHGSFAYQVPPRPIIEPAIENSKEGIGELLGIAAKQSVEGNDTQDALKNVGQEAQQDVQNWFTDAKNGWAPNAPSTIKRKKSDKPLLDTEMLQKSITFVVRGEDDD